MGEKVAQKKRRGRHIWEWREQVNCELFAWRENYIWQGEKQRTKRRQWNDGWLPESMRVARDQARRKGLHEQSRTKKRAKRRREGGVKRGKWGKLELEEEKDRKKCPSPAPADKTGQISYRTLSSPFIEPSLPPLRSCPSAEKLITRATHLSLRQPAQSQQDAKKKKKRIDRKPRSSRFTADRLTALSQAHILTDP